MLDEATLRRLYLDEQLSIRVIATQVRVSTRAIYDALKRYHIQRRPAGFRALSPPEAAGLLDEASLRRLYVEEQRSIKAIADLGRVSTRTVFDALSRHRIPRRSAGYRAPLPRAIALPDGRLLDEALLRRLYLDEGRSIVGIAAALQCTPSRIRNALIRWGIPRRHRGRPCASDLRVGE